MKKYFKYIIILFIISIGIGVALSYVNKNGKVDISAQNISGNTTEVGSEENLTIQTSSEEEKVSKDTIFEVETKYEDCKHTEVNEYEAPKELINLTEEEIANDYPEYIVVSFSKDKVCLYNTSEGLCNEHFKISINDDNMIVVYKLNSDYDTEIYQETEISAEYLSEDDQKELEEGIYIYGISDLNTILENFE